MMARSTALPCLSSEARLSQVLIYFIMVSAASRSPDDLAASASLLYSSLMKTLRYLSAVNYIKSGLLTLRFVTSISVSLGCLYLRQLGVDPPDLSLSQTP